MGFTPFANRLATIPPFALVIGGLRHDNLSSTIAIAACEVPVRLNGCDGSSPRRASLSGTAELTKKTNVARPYLASRLSAIPLGLAGATVGQVTNNSVTVWLPLKQSATFGRLHRLAHNYPAFA